ncbi:class I SAM-dependent methyltransferase [Paracraurococcus lichenis]|uniref:Class I SAM-dependent methyltransferase n=1 Tax=Paracraurococcus lichenis TaxID=3064888 RepID=A0ABT9DU78_9PROT|nr:class I SAM-dependent methyltransferase [Paracraurococcus sp. LOR1-02]MDO9707355.1 class I SAM-dependent methyltransferase [Paracraurococcus sp. LOR1-02]
MPDLMPALAKEARLDAAARHVGDPWLPQHPYFDAAEAGFDILWRTIEPHLAGADFTCVLDLATGRGRNARRLLPLARRLILVDIRPENIAFCRDRFGDDPKITYIANNGYDLREVPDGSVTLLYSFDAMVHFDSDVVRAYLGEARRIMAPGARAVLHHSNYVGGEDWLRAPHCRNFMSRPLFAHYARKEGLRVLRQEVMEWGGIPRLDCISLLQRD